MNRCSYCFTINVIEGRGVCDNSPTKLHVPKAYHQPGGHDQQSHGGDDSLSAHITVIDGYEVTVGKDGDLYYHIINGMRYGKKQFKTPEKAVLHAKDVVIPIRKQIDAQRASEVPGAITPSDMGAIIADEYFKGVKKRGF